VGALGVAMARPIKHRLIAQQNFKKKFYYKFTAAASAKWR
jgi:hypothetical protein